MERYRYLDRLKSLIIFLSVFLIAASADTPILTITRYPQIIVYEPAEKGKIVVFLHGGCGFSNRTCELFSDSVRQSNNWLICPGGSLKCEKPGREWKLKTDELVIERSINITKLMFDDRVIDEDRVVIGFSLGAKMAVKLIEENSKYKKAVLLSAFVRLDSSKLKDKEIILGAGRKDMTYDYLKKLNMNLKKNGVKSKFVEIGNIGHELPKNIGEILRCQNIY